MDIWPKISVVLVNYNLGDYLEEAIRSIISQEYPNLEFILIDGGSTDSSLEVIHTYQSHFTYWISEADSGQYEAVQKGFEVSTGEIMCWLNSDDKYQDKAFFTVAEIFTEFKEVSWLMGFPTEYTNRGEIIHRITLPWCRWSKWRYYTFDFQFIQQESTFWRRDLWNKAGATLDVSLKLAGDLELWTRFFRHEKLYTTLAVLGGFRYRKKNQRSRDQMQDYIHECVQVIKKEIARFSFGQRIALKLLRHLGFPMGLFHYYDIPVFRGFYRFIYDLPPILQYNFKTHKYERGRRLVKHPPLLLGGKQRSLRD